MMSSESAEHEANSILRLEEHSEKLLLYLGRLRLMLNPTISNGRILAVIQENPCYLKCSHEIRYPLYDNNIDPFYLERHRYVKTKLIDNIIDKLGHLVEVTSEQCIPTGRLDISITPQNKILLLNNKRKIAIEIKTGMNMDLFQVERYMIESDLLIIIRVPTEEVVSINSSQFRTELIKSISTLTRKTQRLTDNDIRRVQGEWCRGCTATCEHKKPKRNNIHTASIGGFERLTKNVDVVIDKVIKILKDEIGSNTVECIS